jgi:CBS-domain-containing membrane protein
MSLATICTRHVITVDAGASLAEAARRLREHHVGALVVTRATPEGVAVAGVVTDRDLAVEVLARGLDAGAVAVGALVQGEPVAVAESAGVDEALARMREHGVRRLLVAGAQGQLVGIVTLDDLLGALAAQLGALAQVVAAGLERETQQRGALAPPPIPAVRIPAVGTAGWTPSTRW